MKELHPQTKSRVGSLPQIGAPPAQPRAVPKPPETVAEILPPESTAPEALLERGFQELVRFYRHSSCGRLCRGVVHRMSAPLQALFFLLELLENKSLEELKILPGTCGPGLGQVQTFHRYRLQKIQQFRRELESLQGLTRNLILQGGHEEAEDCRRLSLNEVYGRELELYQAQSFFKHRVEKRFHFQPDLPPLAGYYIDFSQSFRNLLENALEAMADSPHPCLTVATTLEGGCFILQLGDTGPGIAPGIRPRIFEPFFTTKGSRHAGLGLFMTQRLLAPYHGEIRVDSIPGETWFTVTLPVS